ncbi:MAG: hypothetical protein M3O07_00380 [Pseudomonadota bacterium]|nr:hypothetical protein [Pseudomonadota bacterium]
MKRKSSVAALCALVLPLSIGAAQAAKPVDPSSLPKVECSALKFSEAFLSKYPKAPEACLEARDLNGKRYAKFDAKVYITGPDITTVTLVNAEGDSLDTFSLKPGPDQKIKINGKDTKFSELRVGEKITFWVSEDRMEASELPGSSESSWAVLPPLKKP